MKTTSNRVGELIILFASSSASVVHLDSNKECLETELSVKAKSSFPYAKTELELIHTCIIGLHLLGDKYVYNRSVLQNAGLHVTA